MSDGTDEVTVEGPERRTMTLGEALGNIFDRLDRIETGTTCVVTTDINGHVYRTGCDVALLSVDWSEFEFCPKCGKRLVGHDKGATE